MTIKAYNNRLEKMDSEVIWELEKLGLVDFLYRSAYEYPNLTDGWFIFDKRIKKLVLKWENFDGSISTTIYII